MGIDLELADCAEARYRREACRRAGMGCGHEPDCEGRLAELLEGAARDRPGAWSPSEFDHFRGFGRTIERMLLTGMGYEAEVQDQPGEGEDGYLRWRSQTVAGKAGIPVFKLRTNDRWLVTAREVEEALEAYAGTPVEVRAGLELDPGWVQWVAWLEVARGHGGFEAE